MKLSGHLIGLLKEYMHDLVEQARQEAQSQAALGLTAEAYRPDQALSDLLAILDDRIESEGVQVGMPAGFLHEMWVICNDAQTHVKDRVWLEGSLDPSAHTKATVRELAYRALMEYIENQ
jgi:hypothetical protein